MCCTQVEYPHHRNSSVHTHTRTDRALCSRRTCCAPGCSSVGTVSRCVCERERDRAREREWFYAPGSVPVLFRRVYLNIALCSLYALHEREARFRTVEAKSRESVRERERCCSGAAFRQNWFWGSLVWVE